MDVCRQTVFLPGANRSLPQTRIRNFALSALFVCVHWKEWICFKNKVPELEEQIVSVEM